MDKKRNNKKEAQKLKFSLFASHKEKEKKKSGESPGGKIFCILRVIKDRYKNDI